MDKKAVQIIKSINNTDLGNDDKPNAKAYNDIPDKFYTNLYRKGMNKEDVVNRSKAVGEPPLMLAISAFTALKNAVNNKALKAPANPENILMAIKK